MRKNLILIGMLLAAVFSASAQTGTWSGKLDVQGTKISLVFHLDGDNPTMDSPDQGVKGIPIEVARTATGSIIIKAPSIGATYEGLWLVKQIVGTFKQMGASQPTERAVPLRSGGGLFPQRRRCLERYAGVTGRLYP